MNRTIINVIIAVLVCFCVGMTARWFQTESLVVWYPNLVKSGLTPPNSAFPIVWGILYLCIGISGGLMISVKNANKTIPMVLFVLQLLFNFLWSYTFFYLQNPLLGLVNILILDIVVVWYTVCVYPIKKVSAWLFIPYIIWVVFATYLNAFIYFLN